MTGRELFREGGLIYKVLDKTNRDAAMIVLARAFCSEPYVAALGKLDPVMETPLHSWVEFIEFWMDYCSSNGLSVIALDPERDHRICGVFILRDLFYYPPGFEQCYDPKTSAKTLTPWMNFLWDLDAEAAKNFPPLATTNKLKRQGDFVDLWFLGVDPDYRGRGIANVLVRATLPLIKAAGFKYGTIEATSAFTSKAAAFNNFTEIGTIEAKNWFWKGKPLYTNAPEPHGIWRFWVKDLSTI